MKGGTRKGFPFERKISRLLSLWWTDNADDSIFWKTESSGGRATSREKKGKKTKYSYGDITFKDPIGQPFIDYFLIECKKGYSKDLSVLDLIDSKKKEPLLIKWWIRAERDREFADRKRSLIVFERNSKKTCVVMESSFFYHLDNYCGIFEKNNIGMQYNQFALVIISLEDFFGWVSPETIKLFVGEIEGK